MRITLANSLGRKKQRRVIVRQFFDYTCQAVCNRRIDTERQMRAMLFGCPDRKNSNEVLMIKP